MLQNISQVKSVQEGNQQYLKRNRRQTIQSNNQLQNPFNSALQVMGSALSNHLKSLRRSNLISLLAQKQPQQRNDKENKMIMQMLKSEPFFQTIANNYKYFYQISSKIGYCFYKKDQIIYKIHQFTQGYFILIKGQVQLTIPQRIDLPESGGKLKIETFLTNSQSNLNNSKNITNLNSNKIQNKSNNRIQDTGQHKIEDKNQHKIQDKNQHKAQGKNYHKIQDKNNNKIQERTYHKIQDKSLYKIQDSNNHKIQDKKQQPLKLSKRQSKISVRLSRSSSFMSNDRVNSSNQKQDQYLNKKIQKQSKEGFKTTTQFEIDINQKDEIQKQNKQQEQIICEDKVVKIVQEGQCFGQITIGQVNKRATNAIAKQDCHLIIIRKQQYELVSKASLVTQMKALHNFLMKIPLLRKVYRYSLEGFLYYMQQLKFTYKSILYKQDSQIDFIYIIKQGQFTQFKSMKQFNGNTSRMYMHQRRNSSAYIKSQLNQFKQCNQNWREGFFKNIYQGEILGDSQVYMKKQNYMESCKCISQTGIVYKIQKKLFFQKLLSPQNQVPQIKKYLNQKFKIKTTFIQNFMKHQQNQLIQRYLPPSRSYHSSLKKRSQIYSKTCVNQANNQSQNLLVNNQSKNFFDNFNKTIYKSLNKNRLSVHKHKNRSFSELSNKKDKYNLKTNSFQKIQSKFQKVHIPSNIRDIVEIVNQKQKYQNVRRQNAKQTAKIFEFDMQKIPRFIQQKYNHLLNKIKKK